MADFERRRNALVSFAARYAYKELVEKKTETHELWGKWEIEMDVAEPLRYASDVVTNVFGERLKFESRLVDILEEKARKTGSKSDKEEHELFFGIIKDRWQVPDEDLSEVNRAIELSQDRLESLKPRRRKK